MALPSYSRVNWKNYSDTSTPINNTNLNVMDKGIDDIVAILPKLLSINYGEYSVVPDSSNYDNLKTVGNYVVKSNSSAASMTNCPTSTGHRLIIMGALSGSTYFQFAIDSQNVYYRYFSTTWRSWIRLTNSSDLTTITNSILKTFQLDFAQFTELSTPTDYDTITTVGNYVIKSNAYARDMTNCPTEISHRLIVSNTILSSRYLQIVIDVNNIYIRQTTSTGWQNWDILMTKTAVDTEVANYVDDYMANFAAYASATPEQIVESCACVMGERGVDNAAKLVIAHASDTHMDLDRVQRFCDYCEKNVVTFGIISGDLANSYSSDFSGYVTKLLATNKTIYTCLGNHEMRSYSGNDMQNDLLAKYFTPLYSKIAVSNNYYYKDITKGDITYRMIVLNQFDYPETAVDVDDAQCYLSQTQVDWLIDLLDDAITNEYPVLLVAHEKESITKPNTKQFYQDVYARRNAVGEKYYTGTMLGDIINAFKNGGTISESYTTNDADLPTITISHTFSDEGTFIAYINGHSHGDHLGYSNDYNDQLILNAPLANALSDSEWTDIPRAADDETQDNFNVYIIDMDNKYVDVVRIGSNLSYSLKPRKYDRYDF